MTPDVSPKRFAPVAAHLSRGRTDDAIAFAVLI
jgi:hypothetical protein